MKSIFIALVTIIVAFLGAGTAGAEGLSVSQQLDKSHLAFEDSAVFTITLQWQGPQYAYRFVKPLEPHFEKLQVTRFESSVSSKGSGAGEVTLKTFSYTLAPLSPGTGRIEPVVIEYVTYPDSMPGEAVTEPMSVTIDHPLAVPEERTYSMGWIWLLAGLVAVGAAALVVFIKKTRRREINAPVKTAEGAALEQLDRLHTEARGDLKKFQVGLYRILAGFLSARFDIRADELDDEKLVEAVHGTDLQANVRERIGDWIVAARKDKFRPVEAAPGEAIRRENEVREALRSLQ